MLDWDELRALIVTSWLSMELDAQISFVVAAYGLLLMAIGLIEPFRKIFNNWLEMPAHFLRAHHIMLRYFLAALFIVSVAPVYEAAILRHELGLETDRFALHSLIVNDQIHAVHVSVILLALIVVGAQLDKALADDKQFPFQKVAFYFFGWGVAAGGAIHLISKFFPATSA